MRIFSGAGQWPGIGVGPWALTVALTGALTVAVALALALLAVAGPAARAQQAASPQPAASSLAPGLAVTYYFGLIRHVREIAGWTKTKGTAGPPIPMLNYNVGPGEVLTSGASDGVMAVITGFLKFEQSGGYTLLVNSNDGVRIRLGGKQIYDDPDVHPDRLSDPLAIEIGTPGWYALDVLYFERKNTSTLELFWLPPGAADFDFVPAEAFAHAK